MRSFLAPLAASSLVLGGLASVSAQDAPPAPPPAADDGPALTVYSSADPAGFDPQQFISQQRQGYAANASQVPGFGVVREIRVVDVPADTGLVTFDGVAEFIDPTTVAFTDLTDPDTQVLEQTFRFDLASPEKILDRYVGKQVGYVTTLADSIGAPVPATVLSTNGGVVVLQTDEGLRFVPARDAGLRLPALPGGLQARPALVWKLASRKAGPHRIRTAYQTAGITWRADYNLVLDATDTKADLGAWVSLLNVSGAGWPDARLKLIAGDVQRVDARRRGPSSGVSVQGGIDVGKAAGFEEKTFFEYHLYTLPRRTAVPSNATQQITLFPTARDVAVQKLFVYYGLPDAASWSFTPQPRVDRDVRSTANAKVDVYVKLRNAKENALGIPMPRGKVRVMKRDDADGTLEFVGEDLIDHTPKDEDVLVKVGRAFDLVGERKQATFTVDSPRQTMSEELRIVLRNHKDALVRVSVRETLFRWLNWEIVSSSDPFVKKDARTIHFDVDVPANGSKEVTYLVKYTW